VDVQEQQMSSPSGVAPGAPKSGNCPPLSVVIASVHSMRDIERFLDALLGQAAGKEVEIIVAHSGEEFPPDVLAGKCREATILLFPERVSLPELWAQGIRRSNGEIIAIMDSTCPPDEHWVDAVLEAHRSSHPVIGGAVELDGDPGLVDLAAYFCEYGQFMRPLVEGVAQELPGNNLSFKRSVLDNCPEHVRDAFWKTLWCRKLQEEGIELFSTPSIVVRYRRTFRFLPFTVRRFHHGRCFAGMRISRTSVLTRMLYAVGSTLLPLVFFLRTVRTVASKRRHIGRFVLSLPVSLTAIASWSIGEFCGYVAGPGRSCARVR
jgi:thiol-disulfide isomerase/thioredoxin